MNSVGREFIPRKFEERFSKKWIWDRFKNKVDVCRKAYVKFKKLTHNRTGLVYDAMGRLEMPDAWWDQRIARYQNEQNSGRCDQPLRSTARHGNEQLSDNRCDQTRDLETNNYQRHQVAAASRRLWSLTLATAKQTGP
uniref:Myb/SANT-like domain-containing protein n=1 Tax=Brassica oleracea TaxID=3712 RepID=A0A3P6EF30_BRAOL|nr:unnamed protein product [Brassica oleracea]